MARPEKGTPEWELWIAAIKVAVDPPLRSTRPTCYVAWRRIEALRAALEACGIDWRAVKEQS